MKDYSFLNTTLIVNGKEITGYDDGDDVIQMGRLEDSASHEEGVDGEMTVVLSASRTGNFIFRLMQSSDDNAYMSSLISTQENGFFVPVFVQFKDVRGNDIVSGTQGYIPRPADMNRGRGVGGQEWRIVVERLDMLHRGGV